MIKFCDGPVKMKIMGMRRLSGQISRIISVLLGVSMMFSLFGCGKIFQKLDGDDMVYKPRYVHISPDEAKLMMTYDDGHVIVDVRRADEYANGHIPGAILIPNESIIDTPPEELPDKKQIILVYCRTGRRSKEASQKLADMGYMNVYEFGGIEEWTGDIVTDDMSDKTGGKTASAGEGMILKINGEEYPVEWENNESVEALKALCPLTVKLSMYGGFEQVGSLGKSLPKNDEQTTTNYGDIVLYSGNQIVIFYGSNSWAYTRLGHILADKEIMEETLGNGDVTIELVDE